MNHSIPKPTAPNAPPGRTRRLQSRPRRHALSWLLIAITPTLMVGCGGLDSHVKVQTRPTTLGRVVVYRNGIAYFERRARAKDGRVQLSVPDDKVNDFLKSLTVTDAKTKKPLPVSFPTRKRRSRGDVQMTIQLPDRSVRDVIVTYISDSPAWKPTYRLMIDKNEKVTVQGWAVVDNTSGEDWKQVRVGVGSSSALSFRYDLRSVRRVYRQSIRHGQVVVHAPPTGGAIHNNRRTKRVVMDVSDDQIARPKGHPEREVAQAPRRPMVVETLAGTRGSKREDKDTAKAKAARVSRWHRYRQAQQRYQMKKRMQVQKRRRAEARTRALSSQLRRHRGTIVIEGYAKAGEARAIDRALDRANVMRNRLIRDGIAPARVKVVAKGAVAGRRAGVRVIAKADSGQKGRGSKVAQVDTPIGESHFESQAPVTVTKGTSAMVSIVNRSAHGDVVYLYNPDGQRGNAQYAFRAVRFKNPTGSTLEGGPVTVYGRKRFIGEGLTEAIPPGSHAIVPFAMDRQVRVDRHVEHKDRIERIVDVHRGVLTAKVAHLRKTTLEVANRSVKPVTIFLRHRVGRGWKLIKTPKVVQTVREARVLRVKLAPQSSRKVVMEESTPLRRVIDLRSQVGVDLVTTWLKTPRAKGPLTNQLRVLVGTHRQIRHAHQRLASLRQRSGEFRTRMDELHAQIVSLDGMRRGGGLLRHLQTKMKQMSQRVQATTMKVVEEQEQLMLARIRYEDGVSELTLDKKPTAAPKARRTAALARP
ncbi:MAG: DUF4139 domain-containing protein [Myxococcales bacterium]|nr:DUF4139 domain-containing protein [Myxococcales bacterium]